MEDESAAVIVYLAWPLALFGEATRRSEMEYSVLLQTQLCLF